MWWDDTSAIPGFSPNCLLGSPHPWCCEWGGCLCIVLSRVFQMCPPPLVPPLCPGFLLDLNFQYNATLALACSRSRIRAVSGTLLLTAHTFLFSHGL